MHDQTRGLQRITQFTPLADALARMAARVRPVAAQKLKPAAALGHILAEDISLEAYNKLGCRDDGEVIPKFEY